MKTTAATLNEQFSPYEMALYQLDHIAYPCAPLPPPVGRQFRARPTSTLGRAGCLRPVHGRISSTELMTIARGQRCLFDDVPGYPAASGSCPASSQLQATKAEPHLIDVRRRQCQDVPCTFHGWHSNTEGNV